ncbi:acetyltransferase, GNAT family [Acetobacteraceae bacterium AT-5844]|nr:acetyltransferase, GNAT family [Acetobacteraceae bacterium AT-5844]
MRDVAPSLRRLRLGDMDAAAKVLRASFDERLPWLAGLHTPAEDRAFFRNVLFSDCQVWGAEEDRLLGIIAFRQGWIDQLYVLPGHQGRGIGAALLDIAKATFDTLQLWTFQKNGPARRFYEARGFIAIQETDGQGNEEREPDVLYRWEKALPEA